MMLYIHVPFCSRKCSYCSFTSWQPEFGEPKVYLDTLLAEIPLWSRRLGRRTISSIFIGGGTPSTLPPAAIASILSSVSSHFTLAKDIEVTMEANPASGHGVEFFSSLLRAGVNRLSLGAQSLDDRLLRVLGRVHTSSEGINALHDAREAGFSNINLDFMWGLPGQRLSRWKEDLKYIVLHLKPEHLSCYGLTLEKGTKLCGLFERGEIKLPSEKEQGHMFVEGAEFLEEFGYIQYEISNFAKMGFECKHNLGYWAGRDYLGIGPAAVSTIKGRRWTNPLNLVAYQTMVAQKAWPTNVEELSLKERATEYIMLRLRTAKGLDLKGFKKLTGADFFKENKAMINTLHGKGLVRIRNGHLSLTRMGMLVSNTILSHMSDSLPELEGMGALGEADHEKAKV